MVILIFTANPVVNDSNMNDGGKDNINVDNNDTYSNVCITLYAH